MTRRAATSVEQLVEDFKGRLVALANVHSAVFQTGGEAVQLSEVTDITFMPYASVGENRITAKGPPVLLSRAAGTSLALCLHELATNAIKYGALSCPNGQVNFTWELSSQQDNPILTIHWTESGGPIVSEPAHTGYGTNYVRGALNSLFGAPPVLAFLPSGLQCTARGLLARVSFNAASAWSLHGAPSQIPPFSSKTPEGFPGPTP
jgi:two-component sensor histidine kinase